MSVGHLRGETKTTEELYLILGEADTSKLYGQSVKLDTMHDIPYAGGVSVDGRTVYIDRKLYTDLRLGKVRVRGMTWKQVVQCWIEHEHTEKSVVDGDNPVDVYLGAHAMATTKENETAKMILGNADRYEDAIEPALKACAARDPVIVPKDLWCGPYLDAPSKRDLEILRIFRSKGVVDAFKHAKSDPSVMYGIAARRCGDCKHFESPGKTLSLCEVVAGRVREGRQCLRYVERKGASHG